MQALALLGWTDGRNVRIETRWGAGDADRYCQYAAELLALAPDVVVAATCQQFTHIVTSSRRVGLMSTASTM